MDWVGLGHNFFVFSELHWTGSKRQCECEMGCRLTCDISVSMQLTVASLLATLRLLSVVQCVKYSNVCTRNMLTGFETEIV